MNIELRQLHNYNDTKLNVETALNHDTRKYRKYLSSIIYDNIHINRDFKLKIYLENVFSINLPSEYSGSNVPNLARLDYFLSCYGRFP